MPDFDEIPFYKGNKQFDDYMLFKGVCLYQRFDCEKIVENMKVLGYELVIDDFHNDKTELFAASIDTGADALHHALSLMFYVDHDKEFITFLL